MTPAEICTIVIAIISAYFAGISAMISMGSLVVAFVNWNKTHQVEKNMLEIEVHREQDRLAEQNMGKIILFINKKPQEILVCNKGAIGITITDIVLNGFSIRQNPYINPGSFPQSGIKLPINGHYTIEMSFGRGAEKEFLPPYDAIVKWVTEKGEEQQEEMTVNWV